MCPSEQDKYEEKFVGGDPSHLQKDGSVQIIEDARMATPKAPTSEATPRVSRTGPKGMIIRGMTFYKSEPDPMVADDGDPGENCKWI